MIASMLNPKEFNTKVPLPTLVATHPEFDPVNGYWRGTVWLDQVYFGTKALQNYGFEAEANDIVHQLFENADGLLGDATIRENYNPITGEGIRAHNFSWSAAHILMWLIDN